MPALNHHHRRRSSPGEIGPLQAGCPALRSSQWPLSAARAGRRSSRSTRTPAMCCCSICRCRTCRDWTCSSRRAYDIPRLPCWWSAAIRNGNSGSMCCVLAQKASSAKVSTKWSCCAPFESLRTAVAMWARSSRICWSMAWTSTATNPLTTCSRRASFRSFAGSPRGAPSATSRSNYALSVKTVSTYRARLLEKMGMKTNADITTYAVRNSLVQ